VTDIEEIEPIKEEVNFGLPQELIRERAHLDAQRSVHARAMAAPA